MTEYRPETSIQNIYTTFTPTGLQNYTPTNTPTANYTFGDLTFPNKDGNQFEYKVTSDVMINQPILSSNLPPNECPQGYTIKSKFMYNVSSQSGEIQPAELNNYCISDKSIMYKNPSKQLLTRLCGNPDYAILVDNVNFVYKCAYNPSS